MCNRTVTLANFTLSWKKYEELKLKMRSLFSFCPLHSYVPTSLMQSVPLIVSIITAVGIETLLHMNPAFLCSSAYIIA